MVTHSKCVLGKPNGSSNLPLSVFIDKTPLTLRHRGFVLSGPSLCLGRLLWVLLGVGLDKLIVKHATQIRASLG